MGSQWAVRRGTAGVTGLTVPPAGERKSKSRGEGAGMKDGAIRSRGYGESWEWGGDPSSPSG